MPTIVSDGGSATANISLAEDRRGVTRVVAIDPNPGPITYSIIGGSDQALFAINATSGLLWLVNVPDFETPADANHDNAYVVQVQASNGSSTATQAITVNVTDVNDITGTPHADFLIGTSSGEVLDGLGGSDLVLANAGNDTILINQPGDGIVTLLDFWTSVDTLGLDQIGFGIAGNGSLASNGINYVIGSAANTPAPTIIFNPSSSFIFWDADGTGPTAPVAFAHYDPGSTVFWIASKDVGSHPAGWLPAGNGDFNADGTTDLVWFNSATNDIDIWKISNGQWAGSSDVGSHPAGYQPAGFGDYNGDHTSDVLWFNPTTRDLDLWKISNGQWAGSVDIGIHPAGSQPALTGDFNGDGTSDIAWYNSTTNAVEIWKISNGQWAGSVSVGSHPAGYAPVLAGDFNGDGTSDIAWYNATTGDLDIWKMSNGQWAGSVDTGPHPAGWQPLGAADFNLDGTSDIVWYNPTNHNIDIWLINNGQWVGSANIGSHPGPPRDAIGVGDFDHDGVSDIMWRDVGTGAIEIWRLTDRTAPAASDFNIEGNIVPNVSIPIDTDVAANSVIEGAANGTTVGLTASSTNPSGAPVSYSLSDSAAGRFAIDASSGVVSVANGSLIDFESASGHAYSITVQATSGALVSSRTFSIGVADVAPTVPSDANGATNTVAEGAANGTPVGLTVASSDVNGGALTYSLTDSAGGRFAIDPSSGVVTVANGSLLDFETATSHTITAQASDGSLTSSQTFTIGVSDVAPSNPVDTSGSTGGAVAEGAANGTAVAITVFSTDPNGPASSYALTNDAGGRFAVDPSTGVVTVANSGLVDFEASGGSYTITARATAGALSSTTQDFVIAVTDVAPSTPTDINGAANTVLEGAANGTTVGITASSSDPNGPAPVFSLSDSAGGRFAIDSSTGIVTVANSSLVDFESASGHAYSITVQATAGALSSSQSFSIAVGDVAPTVPTDANGAANTVAEGAATGTPVGITASSSDVNGGTLTYSLTDNAGGRFQIDSSTGVVTVANGALIDFESQTSHNITVQASDGAQTSQQTFTIAVTDVNDNAPVFTSGTTGSEAENTAASNIVYDASATDADATAPNNTIVFSLSAGGDNDFFNINSSTGEVTFKVSPDFEAPGDAGANNVYDIVVHANDGVHDVTRNVAITVTDLNDNAPIFTSGTTASTGENVATSTAVYTASAPDADGTAANNTVTYSLAAAVNDNDLFNINPTTGAVTFKVSPDFENPTDAGANNVYDIVVTASDGLPAHDATRAVAITVTDLNDNAPVFTSGSTGSEAENTAASNIVYDANATDADATPANNTITFSLSAGGDNDFFNINSSTGEVTFKVSPDFEAPGDAGANNVYDIVVHANDGVHDVTKNVPIFVTDLNDNAPVFSSGTTGSEAENSATSNVAYDANATDADGTPANNTIGYSLSAGGDNDKFDINPTTGEVTFKVSPDFEAPTDAGANNVYDIVVHANDGLHDVTRNVAISVTDVNDNAPIFSSGTTASTAENVSTATAVYTAAASDADGTAANNTVTYSLAAGVNDNDLFNIDSSTGAVTFKTSPDFENPADAGGNNVYDIVVTGSDGLPAHDTTRAVAITVTDLNDNSPIFQSGTTGSEFENSPTSTIAYDANATDADGTPANNTISYSLSSGGDNDFFNINSATGEVTFKVSPDFENPQDAGGNDVYDIVVHANDGTNDTTQNVAITVNDINDPPTLNATPNNPVYTGPNADPFSSVTASANDAGQSIDQLVFTVSNVDDSDETMSIDGSTVALLDATDVGPTIPNGVSIHVDVAANTATVTISKVGGVSAAIMAAIVDGMTYTDASVGAATTRDVTLVSLHDTGDSLNGGNPTGTINITSTINFDQPPTITAGGTLNYTEDDGAKVIDNGIVVGDPDDPNLQSATVKISGGFVSGEDVLSFVNTANITGSFVGDTLTLTGSDTLANYQAALRSVKYTDTSQDPSGADRTISWTVNDGSITSTAATSTIHVAPVNDQPTLSATGLSPGFTENGSAVDLYSTVTASTIEAGQSLDQLILTVTNVAGTGATESLFIDGTTVELNNGNSETTATHSMTASVSLVGGTATITVSKVSGISAADMQTLVDNLAYGNTSDDPGAASRVVTITSLEDTGSNVAPNDNINSTLSIASTVAVTPVNDPPTLTATSGGGTFTEPAASGLSAPTAAAVDLFSGPVASTIEAGQAFKQIVVTVSNVADTTEFLNVSGTAVDLVDGNSEGVTGGTASVAVSGGTATVTIDATTTFTQAQVESLVDSLAYDNNDDSPTATSHTITITSLTDNGGTASGGVDTSSLSLSASVTVVATNDAPVAQNFDFTGASANDVIGNTALVLDDGAAPAAPDPAGPQKTITGSLLTGATDPDGPGPLVTVVQNNVATTHGHVTVNASGEFSYTPNAGYTGTDTFNYQISDQNPGTPGLGTGSITVKVVTPHVWYVNADAASDGTGTSDNPFNTLTHFAGAGGVDTSGDIIFLYNASNHYTGGLTLESNEKLIGQDVGLTVNGTPLEAATGVNGAIIEGGVVLGIDNTISGVTLGNTGAGTALSGTSFGTLNVDHTVVNTDNDGMILSTGAFGAGAAFTSFTSAGATDVSLTSVTGSVDLGSGTMSGQFAVNGGSVNTTYSGSLSQANNASMVDVSGGHSGTLTFSGTLSATNGTGLQFNNADGTYNFNGTNTLSNTVGGANANAGIDIVNGSNGNFSFSSNSSITGQTSTGETAFNVSGAGAGNITYAGTIGATGATDNAGASVSIAGHTGGTVAFSGSILDSSDTGGGISVSGNADTTVNFSGVAKTLNTGTSNAVSLSSNTGTSNVNFTNGGLGIDTTGGIGFSDSVAGTVSVTGTGNTINSTGGTALNLGFITVGAGGLNFDSTTSGGGANNVTLNTVTGTGAINLGTGTLSGATGVAFSVSGGTGNIDYNGSIAKTSDGRVIDVQNHTTGTLSFDGAVSSTSLSDGINLSGNTNATIGFTNTLTLNTSSSGTTAFNASSGGTVTATGTGSTINAGNGSGLVISHSNIGASDVTFQSIASSGGSADGIILDTTGSAGGLHITGTGSADSGGIIATKTGADGSFATQGTGIYLNSTSDVQLNDMHLHDFQNFGIRGFSVNGFTLTNSTIDATASASAKNGTTDAADEDSMKFGTDDGSSNGVTGTLTITNSTISDGFENNFEIYNHTGSLTFTVSGSTFSKTSTVGPGNGGFRIQTDGSANVTGTITTSTFDQNRSRGIDLIQQGSGNMDIDIGQAGVAGSGGTFSDNGISVDIVQNGSGTLNFNVLNGTFTSANYATIFGAGGAGSAINIDRGGAASVVARGAFTGNIDNNNINNSDSGTGPGISVDINGTDNTGAANTFKLDGNTITHVQNFGILVATGDGNGLLNATITNNNVTTTLAGGLEAIRVNGGKTSSQAGSPGTPDNGTLNFDIHGNTVLASAAGGTTDIRVRQRFNVTDKIEGYGGSATDDAAVAAYLAGLNTHSGGGSATVSADHASTGFGTIAAVTEPPAPLLAFNGGVAAQTPTAGEMSLSAAELAAAVAAGMEYWAAAGLSPAQLATLQQVSYSIGDAPAGWLSASTAGHIAMSADGAGHGWFIDPTPFDSSEFANALSGTQLMANAADAPAGHMDLLTAVVHEMGQQLGLSDLTVPEERGDVMYVGLTDGERRLPSASDVNDINQNAIIDSATAAEAQLPDSASAGTGTIIVPGTPNDDTFHISQGSVIVAGGAGADTFIFEQAPTASIPHIADYSALEGDIIDVSAIASLPPLAAAPGAAPGPGASAVAMVRVAEDASGAFAALEVNSAGQWTEVAQLDGVHAGDAVTVIDATHQHQQVHAAWLA